MDFDANTAIPVNDTQFNPATAVPAPQTSQSLGFYEGVVHPLDRLALGISNLPYVGPELEKMNASFGAPSTKDVIASHQEYIKGQEQAGLKPGGVGKFAGEVVGTLPVMAATTNPLVAGGIIGGLLSDSETVGGTVGDILLGAAAGKAADVGLRAVSAASKPVTRYVANKLQDWTAPLEGTARDAAQYVYRLLGDKTPDDIRAAAAAAGSKPVTGAEAIGNTGINAAAAVARRAGATGDTLAGLLSERAEGAGDRILGDYASAAGIAPAAARGDMDALLQAGRDAASKLYTKALSKPGAVWNPDLAALAERPVIAKAMDAAATDLRNAGKDPEAFGFTGRDPNTGKFIQVPRLTAEAWDLVKKNISGQVERDAFGKIIPDSISRGNYNIGVADKALTKALRDAVPGYGDALDVAGDYLSVNKAFQDGQAFINNPNVTAARMAQAISNLTPAQVQAFKGGIANKLFDLAQNGRLSPTTIDKPIFRAKLISALGPDNAKSFLDNLKIEAQMKEAGGYMTPRRGSITSTVLNTTEEQNRSADALMDAIYAGMHLAYGNKLGAGARMLSAARRMGWGARTGLMPEATRDEVGRLLMMNPTDLANHLDAMGSAANPPIIGRVANTIEAARIPSRAAAAILATSPEASAQ